MMRYLSDIISFVDSSYWATVPTHATAMPCLVVSAVRPHGERNDDELHRSYGLDSTNKACNEFLLDLWEVFHEVKAFPLKSVKVMLFVP